MNNIQNFLENFYNSEHTIKEAIDLLIQKGLSREDAKKEISIYIKNHPSIGFDEHP